jgi:hypothetical protein
MRFVLWMTENWFLYILDVFATNEMPMQKFQIFKVQPSISKQISTSSFHKSYFYHNTGSSMRSLIAAWYKSTEDLLDYCEPLLAYGDAKDSVQLALYVLFCPLSPRSRLQRLIRTTISLRGMNSAVHFLEGRVAHDDQNSIALAEECNHQVGKLHYTLLDVS